MYKMLHEGLFVSVWTHENEITHMVNARGLLCIRRIESIPKAWVGELSVKCGGG